MKAKKGKGIDVKAKSRTSKRKQKARRRLFVVVTLTVLVLSCIAAKGNRPKVAGYIYDSGDTLWEMAERHCPNDMDIRDFIKEIKKANGMDNSVVYEDCLYKVPIYETEIKGDYLDMNTVVDYEVSNEGVLLITDDGNGYFIDK